MKKYLIMCEGPNEETIINILLDSEHFKYNRDDLIGLRPYHIRNLKSPQIKDLLRFYNKPVNILRIGDTQTDKLQIPKDLRDIVSEENITKYCTKPELEILLIINEGMYNKFIKTCRDKSQTKEFAKDNIIYNGVRYNQTNNFLMDYYGGKGVESLVNNIKEYKRLKKKSHEKDEHFLADLLK